MAVGSFLQAQLPSKKLLEAPIHCLLLAVSSAKKLERQLSLRAPGASRAALADVAPKLLPQYAASPL